MSYEGYSQFLCAKGHQWMEDCSMTASELKDNVCPTCALPAIWENMVDTTNGSHDEKGKQIDGYIELKIKERRECKECHETQEVTYKIPRRRK